MAIALGCIRLSLDDFWRCTPGEFRKIFDRWKEDREIRERGEWERVRFAAYFYLMPYLKKGITIKDIAEFPWEKEKSIKPNSTRESFDRAIAKWNEITKETDGQNTRLSDKPIIEGRRFSDR